MFYSIQKLVGFAFVIIGIISLLAVSPWIGGILLFGGFVLISLGELILLLKGMHDRQLGLPPSKEQLHRIIQATPKLEVFSGSLTISPVNGTEYPVIELDGEKYVRGRAFVRYMSQTGNRYSFEFPNTDKLELRCAVNYSPGVSIFGYQEQVFVKLSVLPIAYRFEAEKLIVEALETALQQ
ncbi:hypothetical protein [Paenibacillus gorillae]|uniref:hypothetical protein n=1 Tax=Paenibacillus gorillae TaxID=1243662 RepID=UPI0004B0C2F2|nr:hypothetical protein [Paenibacillus gorillae]